MAKDAYYFSHDSNARNDQKIMKIRMEFGCEGYGIYFMIIEVLRETENYTLGINDIPQLAFEFRCEFETVNSIIKNFDLFTINENEFWSESLKRRMEKLDAIKIKRSLAGKQSHKQSSVKQVINKSKSGVNKYSKEEYSKEEHSKEEQSKVKENIEKVKVKNTPTKEQFLLFAKESCTRANKDFESLKFTIEAKFDSWEADCWYDGMGNKISNWRTKFNSTLPYLKEIKNKENDSNRYNVGKQDYTDLAKHGFTEFGKD